MILIILIIVQKEVNNSNIIINKCNYSITKHIFVLRPPAFTVSVSCRINYLAIAYV